MITTRNVVNISGGLTADPERPSPSIVTMRLGVDFSGQEKDSDNKSGYFDVKMFLNDDNQNTKFVISQLDKGNFKKGSSVSVVGRLVQERWTGQDGTTKASKVVIYAEAIEYWGRAGTASADKPGAGEASGGIALPTQF